MAKKEKQLKDSEKKELLNRIVNETNRANSYPVLKFASQEKPIERDSFGIAEVDDLVGGGLPRRRFNILWGPKAAGKTSLAYRLIAEAQIQGRICLLMDLEHSFESSWAELNGVDTDKLLLGSGFKNVDVAMDTLIHLIQEKAVDFVVIDSIQAMSPKGEQENKNEKEIEMQKSQMALLPKLMGKFLRRTVSGIYKSDVSILLIGQTRTNIGGFVAFEQLTGGNALMHFASMILNITRGSRDLHPFVYDYPEGVSATEDSEDQEDDDESITYSETEKTSKKKKPKKEKIYTGFDCVVKLEKRKVPSKPEGSKIHIPFYFNSGFCSNKEFLQKQEEALDDTRS